MTGEGVAPPTRRPAETLTPRRLPRTPVRSHDANSFHGPDDVAARLLVGFQLEQTLLLCVEQ